MSISITESLGDDGDSTKIGAVEYSQLEDIDLLLMMAYDPEAAEEYIKRHGDELMEGTNEAP